MASRTPKNACFTWVTISKREDRAFSTASSTSCPETSRLFHSCAFTKGIAAVTPALYVFQRPTSIPSDVIPEEESPSGIVIFWPVAASNASKIGCIMLENILPPPMPSIYITCFLMVR